MSTAHHISSYVSKTSRYDTRAESGNIIGETEERKKERKNKRKKRRKEM
jgi:hypothetical protein